ncbi:isoaspartyl dipeptidase [compost metagenome]
MASSTPAKILKIQERKGEIVNGKDADIVIFDEGINIDTTIVKGNVVYSKEKI